MGTRKLRLLYEIIIAPVAINAVAEMLGNRLCVGLDTFFPTTPYSTHFYFILFSLISFLLTFI